MKPRRASHAVIGIAALITAFSCYAHTSKKHHKTLPVVPTPVTSPSQIGPQSDVTTQWGTVSEPAWPTVVCGTPLQAKLMPVDGSVDTLDADPANSQPDTARIQAAIDACPAGQAVKLTMGYAGESGFLSGPLQLKSGVTLWIDRGVTLFASRNPANYDNGVGTCGTATVAKTKSCNPLILASNTTGSGIVGEGVIDGRGGSLLTSGPNAGKRSWWDVAYQNKSAGLNQQNPRLVQVSKGAAFTLHGITLENSPNFHIVIDSVAGATAWGIKILSPSLEYTKAGYACPSGTTPDVRTPATCFTPDTVKNTDGFDPGQSSNVLLAYSYISTGDDHVAVKASKAPVSQNLVFAHNHFYYGHGMSIGSETNSGVSNVLVTDLTMDGHDSPNGNGLRIKSDSSRGGVVRNVRYENVCMRNVHQPLVFDPYYSSAKGSLYPSFTGVVISGFRDLGSAASAGSQVTFSGYAANGVEKPLEITLDNVVFDGVQPTLAQGHNGSPSVLPAYAHFTLGPGPVSFANSIVTSTANDVTVSGSPGNAVPVDCSCAFVPLKSVLPDSPI
ncbi:glycoside hydrolase family 28 protein [Trinickia caryophylli]|uniref:Polygalacturonase n=1 Tax=Trinickia caryophylli TaxID=28094 RepID=A0A1X7CK55_TRICW|nr:glycoside hydrolase family 28 protein [Trinickia caryophylli]SME98143.1 polygalacturonase [Trinickia caryophylli]